MPDHLRALVVILALVPLGFLLAQKPVTERIIPRGDYVRRRNAWIACTLIAFFAHNFWVYIAAVAMVVTGALRTDKNRLAMFFFLVLALPRIWDTIPLFGGLNQLFDIDYQRLLCLTILLPLALQTATRVDAAPPGRLLCDKLLLLYLGVDAALRLQDGTVTSILRHCVFYPATDVMLPYYVTSRALTSLRSFRETLGSFVVGAAVLSPLLVFECMRDWLLYAAVDEAMGLHWEWNGYVIRGGNVRAVGTMGHPIVAGTVAMVAIGFFYYLARNVRKPTMRIFGCAVLGAGLVAALSRAPWVGAAGVTVLFLAMGSRPWAKLGRLSLWVLAGLPVLLGTRQGQTILDHLPWIGTVDARNVEGRQELASVSFEVFLRNPWFGRIDYLADPQMEALRGSDNIIDVVNTYVDIGLRSGIVGLGLFVAFFATALCTALQGLWRIRDKDSELHALGRALLGNLAALLFLISTMSFALIVPLLGWSLAGMCISFANLAERGDAEPRQHAPHRAPRPRRRLLAPRAADIPSSDATEPAETAPQGA